MNTAYVKIWGELVGAVAWDEASGIASFEYEPSFKQRGWDISPLQMSIMETKNVFAFPALRKHVDTSLDTFRGLPGALADVLPDRYGNDLLNVWLAQHGRPIDSMNAVQMLCFIGTRGMGALEFEPATLIESRRTFSVEIESLVELSHQLLTTNKTFTSDLQASKQAIREILLIGTSAGGARPKAVIAYNERTGELRSGQTNAPKGFEHWLIKLDGVSDVQLGASKGYGRVEMAYYNMAIACGINMMSSKLLEENGRAHFMTKRFDREGGSTKHHVQTFCAMKHFDFNQVNNFSYEQLFQTMRELRLSYKDAKQLFRRMIFNVMARNCDDHSKNFAFRLQRGASWELAPAYDICHAFQPQHSWVSQNALSINGKRSDIRRDDLLAVGRSIGIKKSAEIINEIQNTIGNWKTYANEVGVERKIRDDIDATLIRSL